MDIKTDKFPTPIGEITHVTLTNRAGASATLSSLGAAIVSIIIPDRNGNLADVVLGYANPPDYISYGLSAGKVSDRFAHRVWTVESIGPDEVQFAYRSADDDAGYPGNLEVRATYRWTQDNVLELYLSARTDKPIAVNLTNHTYFNLDGHDSGSVLDEYLWLNASRYLPADDALIPTGEVAPVAGTPMDFTKAKPIGRDINLDIPALNHGNGYDNCWVINDWEEGVMNEAAVLASHRSGRQLSVFTTQPAVRVSTCNWLEGCPAGKDGAIYHDYDGVAIACQGMPTVPDKSNFPTQTLRPGEHHRQLIFFKFSTF